MGYSPWGCKESDMTEQLSAIRFHHRASETAEKSLGTTVPAATGEKPFLVQLLSLPSVVAQTEDAFVIKTFLDRGDEFLQVGPGTHIHVYGGKGL